MFKISQKKVIDDPITRGFEQLQATITQLAPPSINRHRIAKIFEETIRSIKRGKINKRKAEKLSLVILSVFKDAKLDSSETESILNSMKEMASP